MDCRTVVFLWLIIMMVAAFFSVEGRTKKVVIHVPFKVKKIKHVHTVYKTVHHHHAHHDDLLEPGSVGAPSDDHEHFHHLHMHEVPPLGAHAQPLPTLGIPDFLPDVPMEMPLDLPDLPHELPLLPHNRHVIPLYRRA